MCLRIILNPFNLKDTGWALKVYNCAGAPEAALERVVQMRLCCPRWLDYNWQTTNHVQSTFQKGKPMTCFTKPYGSRFWTASCIAKPSMEKSSPDSSMQCTWPWF